MKTSWGWSSFLIVIVVSINGGCQSLDHSRSSVRGAEMGFPPGGCELTPWKSEKFSRLGLYRHPKANGLTYFWAQEYIGSDIAAELMQSNSQASLVKVGIVDNGIVAESLPGARHSIQTQREWLFGEEVQDPLPHGNKVANLIIGEPPSGTSSAAFLSYFGRLHSFFDSLRATSPANPRLINISMEVPYSEAELQEYNSLASDGTIFVVASGNTAGTNIGKMKEAINGIIVGSMAIDGFPDSFSQTGKNLTVLAPAGEPPAGQRTGPTLQKQVDFGQTSGAAPLVTAAIADVLAIFPYLTITELKMLLQSTALPTVNVYMENLPNGKGSLNHARLVAVALQLRDRCSAVSDKHICVQGMLRDPIDNSLYLPEFFETQATAVDTCEQANRTLKHLRREFFLGNQNASIALKISEIYEHYGYFVNAEFFRTFTLRGKEDVLRFMRSKIDLVDSERQRRYVHSAFHYKDLPFLESVIKKNLPYNVSAEAQLWRNALSSSESL